MKKVKLLLDRKKYLAWRFCTEEDIKYLADEVLDILEEKDKATITIQGTFSLGYLPLDVVLNPEVLKPEDIDEAEVTEEGLKKYEIVFKRGKRK